MLRKRVDMRARIVSVFQSCKERRSLRIEVTVESISDPRPHSVKKIHATEYGARHGVKRMKRL